MKKHLISIMFPVLTLCLFALCACGLVLVSAVSYQKMTALSQENYNEITAAAYLREKVSRYDEENCIYLEEKDGTDILVLKEEGFTTYIYYYDSYLCELYLEDTAQFSFNAGQKILEVKELKFIKENDNLIKSEITDKDGFDCVYINISSLQEVSR